VVTCEACGTLNEPSAKFCIQCGTKLAVTCAVCGTANLPTARFCSQCGSPMEMVPGQAEPPPALADGEPVEAIGIAERRLVTVLFADLVGFTTLSEDRDPEDTRELLSSYFEIARGVVDHHGGTVEKFIGDAVMAVWGAPVAHEDDAERAVRAALELVAAVGGIATGDGPLRARAGLLTGEAAVTIGARGQGMVAGDLVNTASRLQSVAEPGSVLVGEATYRAASTAVSFESAGSFELKGKAEPMPAWRAIAVVARRGGEKRTAALEPPFVGREDELRQIKDLFEATSRERKPRLVSVIGQAGIGKSRLAWEFEKYLDGVVEEVYWHEGRSPAYGQGISYWALAEMVRRRAGIAETDEPAVVREKLAAMLETFVTDAAERRWVEPRLAGLLGVAELPTEGREELFAAWRTFFERTAVRAPSILVFADLHWADQGLLDFIEYLLAWSRSSPLFVLVLARPELLERRPDWGSQVRSVTRINLEPLSDDEMTRLLEGTLPGLEPAAVQRIVARAEGIPLYAVETARMLLDTGAVVEHDGRYRLVGDISHLAVAETLHALIAARLDATLPADRSLLQDASVLGQSFNVDAVAAVSGTDRAQLDEQLERLIRRQLLIQDTDPRSPERGSYRFIQSLVREVAYQTLAKPDRRARHLAAARYFETLDDDELAGVLATHYLEAHRASRSGPEANALAAQARVALSGAAERAAALHSHQQAISFLKQALTVTDDPTEQAALHLRASESGEYAADLAGAMDHARAARDLSRQVGDGRGALHATTWLGRHEIGYHVEMQAIDTLRHAITDAEPLGDIPELASTLAELSRALMLTEHHDEAVEVADRALVVAGRHSLLLPTLEALINRGSALSNVHRRHEAEAVLRGAIALADRHGLVAASLRARNNLASTRFTDDVDEVSRLYREAYELAARFGHRSFLYQFVFQLAEQAIRAGDWDQALTEIDAIEEAETPYPFYAAAFAAIRMIMASVRGRHEEAATHLERYRVLAEQLSSPMVDAYLQQATADLAVLRGEWELAVRAGTPALDNANTVPDAAATLVHAAVGGNLPEALEATSRKVGHFAEVDDVSDRWLLTAGRAGFAARAGRWDEARAGYRAALDGIRAHGNLLQWALTSLDWGALGGASVPDAADALRDGMAFFADRGAEAVARRYVEAFVPLAAASEGRAPANAPSQPVASGTE
jgi:class 3 adenylate cyclase/tetratricopeptide (TPR) repeat protein